MLFQHEVYGYFPGKYFNCLGFISEKEWFFGQPEERGKKKFRITPYKVMSLKNKGWEEELAIYEAKIKFEKVQEIVIPDDISFSKDGNFLFHLNPETHQQWLTVRELGGIEYLEHYGELRDRYRILQRTIDNYQYYSIERNHKIDALNERLDHLQSELNILRPDNEYLVDKISDMRNSQRDLVKRLEHFKQTAENFKTAYKEANQLANTFVVLAVSHKNLAIASMQMMDRLYDAATGKRVAKAEELSLEVDKFKAELKETTEKVEETLLEMNKLQQRQKKIEEMEAQKIARGIESTGGETRREYKPPSSEE